jgi:hypothetical protein
MVTVEFAALELVWALPVPKSRNAAVDVLLLEKMAPFTVSFDVGDAVPIPTLGTMVFLDF